MGTLDHQTGRILAYVFGRLEDQSLLALKALLVPFEILRYYTDGWGAYQRHLWIHTALWSGSGGPNSWSASLSRCAHGSTAE